MSLILERLEASGRERCRGNTLSGSKRDEESDTELWEGDLRGAITTGM